MIDKEQLSNLPICSRSSSMNDLYSLMFSIRTFETSLLELFQKGVLSGTTHTSLGQESAAVGVISALDITKDIIFSNHRGHGHFLAYCGKIKELYLEILGKPDGICGGRGGSQHLHYRNFYSNGIQGGIVPVSSGMALAEKMKSTNAIVIVFLGDGTFGQGVVYESFNITSLWRLPILFIIENNGYAQSTPSFLQISGTIQKRLEAFNIPIDEIDASDVKIVLSYASKTVDAVRSTCSPHCLLLNTVRLGPHSKGDDHRSEKEMREIWTRDPLALTKKMINFEDIKQIEKSASAHIDEVKKTVLKELP